MLGVCATLVRATRAARAALALLSSARGGALGSRGAGQAGSPPGLRGAPCRGAALRVGVPRRGEAESARLLRAPPRRAARSVGAAAPHSLDDHARRLRRRRDETAARPVGARGRDALAAAALSALARGALSEHPTRVKVGP